MTIHSFNDAEALRIAIEMETRGEAFYTKAARISRNPETVRVFEQLAADETIHRAEFEKLVAKANLSEIAYDQETNAYLNAIAADVVFSDGLMALRTTGFETPEGALMEAIRSEKDSVMFYSELAERASDKEAAKIFEEIIFQEKAHLRTLQLRLAKIISEG